MVSHWIHSAAASMLPVVAQSAAKTGSVIAAEPTLAEKWENGISQTQFVLNGILLAIVILCAVLSVVYSYRFRRSTDKVIRGLSQAKMNISMGIMLIAIALIQIFLLEESWVRAIIGAIFLLIGLFNLFAGLRNRQIYTMLSKKQK